LSLATVSGDRIAGWQSGVKKVKGVGKVLMVSSDGDRRRALTLDCLGHYPGILVSWYPCILLLHLAGNLLTRRPVCLGA